MGIKEGRSRVGVLWPMVRTVKHPGRPPGATMQFARHRVSHGAAPYKHHVVCATGCESLPVVAPLDTVDVSFVSAEGVDECALCVVQEHATADSYDKLGSICDVGLHMGVKMEPLVGASVG